MRASLALVAAHRSSRQKLENLSSIRDVYIWWAVGDGMAGKSWSKNGGMA